LYTPGGMLIVAVAAVPVTGHWPITNVIHSRLLTYF
jgi:hypothetical protein